MTIDPDNPIVKLCAAGMMVEGMPTEARALFEQAWAVRRDDYDACIAAHFLARHQPTANETLYWNTLAAQHAEAVTDGRADGFFASLYLNLAASFKEVNRMTEARDGLALAVKHLAAVPEGGYRDFVAMGIRRLQEQLAEDG